LELLEERGIGRRGEIGLQLVVQPEQRDGRTRHFHGGCIFAHIGVEHSDALLVENLLYAAEHNILFLQWCRAEAVDKHRHLVARGVRDISQNGVHHLVYDFVGRAQFAAADALVFVGAAGIAVRAIAPHCQSKATDPAVVVLDECGRFAVPLLSGHLGGANDLACRLAAACGAVPVITTATDANGLFAVDEWAKKQNCAVWETPRIKFVSGALLAGKTVRYASPWAIAGTPPAGVAEAEEPSGADFALTMTPQGNALHLIPRIGVLGVGCKRGTTAAQLEAAFAAFCTDTNLAPVGITAAASIDLKQNEPGLLEFCRSHGWPVSFYSAAQLRAVPGTFSASRFVQGVTGVDNVCERAAVLASGGTLLLPKYAHTGVTFAAAVRPFAPDWRWKTDEA